MSKVQLHLIHGGEEKLFYCADKHMILTHSKTIRDALEGVDCSDDPKVTLQGAAPGPLRLVLDKVLRHGDKFYLKIGDRRLDIVVAIYQALEVLQIEPEQTHVERHILGHLSHNNLEPIEMIAVHTVFQPKHGAESGRVYFNLVHNIARRLNMGQYTAAEAQALEDEAQKYPTLHSAINKKMAELSARTANYDDAVKRLKGTRSRWT